MKLLIVKTSSLGDIVHAFAVLSYLKEIYPIIQIDWVVEKSFAELVEAHPTIGTVFTIQTKKWRSNFFSLTTIKEFKQFIRLLRRQTYDLVIDLQGNTKSAIVTAIAKSHKKVGFGFKTAPEWLNALFTNKHGNPPLNRNIREDYLYLAQVACNHFQSVNEKAMRLNLNASEREIYFCISQKLKTLPNFKIMICPGSQWKNKQLSHQTLKEFLELIHQKINAHFVLVWGSEEEKMQASDLNTHFLTHSILLEKMPLPVLQNIMNEVDLVLAMDSLPLHLAGTTQTPTYSFFGASSAHKYKPVGIQHAAFKGQCPYHVHFEKRCPHLRTCATGACIKIIDSHELFTHFFEWWNALQQKNK